ncbi:6-phosphogluconolactonase [Erythrobacter sp. NAP1]|uniref:6-phosphogluconolactonase n=1 Tax=Erythrobacter sp. NAP1 TaxID=237727 RepID=UPI00006877FF|nr:6-phosphogluconolactonase [Erythrobacter sp. NAP1]EAQ27983.1 6-phosphogluconolactonase [Erythrobacter sp. NAP1]
MSTIDIIEGADNQAIAQWLGECMAAAEAAHEGGYFITMPGGSTPFPILEGLIAADPGPSWERANFIPNDDRIVPEDHEASNTGKMRALLQPTGAGITALGDLEKVPEFALTWLGMGADGHIASLFPNTDPQVDDAQAIRRITPDPLPANAPFDRITLTLPALLMTRQVVLTLGGSAEKAAVFQAAVAGENDLPIARLLGAAKTRGIPVTCFT